MTGSEIEVIDAEAVDAENVTGRSLNLFGTDDPVEVVEKAGRVAQALKDVLSRQGMVQNIQGREHVKVEGWQTLGSMLGVVPVVTWTREIETGWEARVEARTLDGRVVGAAEAMCSRDERMWSKRDPYALRSMAQTRATSKALKGPLGFIVTLAGYEATPAEEMPHEPRRQDVQRTGASDFTPAAEPIVADRHALLVEKVSRKLSEGTEPAAISNAFAKAGGRATEFNRAALATLTDTQANVFERLLEAA